MSDRKYRQRGYQDTGPREARPATPKPSGPPSGEPRGRPREPRAPNMPGYREVVRCARCGGELTVAAASSPAAQCGKCQADLHACVQCVHFDPGSRFECTQALSVRVSPKDARNTCEWFEPRITFERETRSASAGPPSAKKAFDDLFKL
jgi:predicted nucleic acid-binding Zn ribbon protein